MSIPVTYLVNSKDVPLENTSPGISHRVLLGKKGASNERGPHCHLTWYAPNIKVESHYHPTDQFQVVLEGGVRFPEHSVGPLGFHYVDSRALYGPFTTSEKGMVYAVLRRRNVGIVFSEPPAKKPALEGRQLFGAPDNKPWIQVSEGVRRRFALVAHGDASSPSGEIWECEAGASFQTGPAPFGEFDIFYKGGFFTEGRLMEPYSVRYFESERPGPRIWSETDGSVVIVARFDRPALATIDNPSGLLT